MKDEHSRFDEGGKIFIACALSPWAVVPSIMVFTPLFNVESIGEILSVTFMFSLFGVPLAYAATLVVGLPTHLLLRLVGTRNIYPYSLMGAFFVLIYLFKDGFTELSLMTFENSGMLWLFVLCGVSVATTFGYIVKEKSNENHQSN